MNKQKDTLKQLKERFSQVQKYAYRKPVSKLADLEFKEIKAVLDQDRDHRFEPKLKETLKSLELIRKGTLRPIISKMIAKDVKRVKRVVS